MIKDIEQASNSFSFSNNLTITEKMNMFYFKVIVTQNSCSVISHNHKVITKIECVVNSVWNDIIKFTEKEIEKRKDKIYDKYGNVIIGFFYCPVEKPLHINYSKFFNVDMDNNRFIISNVKSMTTKKHIDISDFCFNVDFLSVRGIGGGSVILYEKEFIDVINSFIKKEIDKVELLKYMNTHLKTFSGNSFNDIEGLVLSDGDKKYQLIINDTKDTKEYDRTQYEMLTKDFIDFWDNNENDIMNNLKLKVDYTHIINELFLHYINTTSLFRDTELSANNLIPPGNAYIGDLDYTIIDNSNVKTVCLLNETYKNVFRILYKGLKQPKKYNSHFTILTENDILKWNKMVDYIWNKKSEK